MAVFKSILALAVAAGVALAQSGSSSSPPSSVSLSSKAPPSSSPSVTASGTSVSSGAPSSTTSGDAPLATFHDNLVSINVTASGWVIVTNNSNFVVESWNITDGQTDPKNAPFVGQVLNMSSDGSLTFHCGRSGSGQVADFWNQNFNSSESTFDHGAGELNFAFIGTLQLQVQAIGINTIATISNVGFAQGHSGSTNNWWFGQVGGKNVGDNQLQANGTDQNGNTVSMTFLRGDDNPVDEVDIVSITTTNSSST